MAETRRLRPRAHVRNERADLDTAPQNLTDLGRGKTYWRTLVNDRRARVSTFRQRRRSCPKAGWGEMQE
jgi:hypothetical protein